MCHASLEFHGHADPTRYPYPFTASAGNTFRDPSYLHFRIAWRFSGSVRIILEVCLTSAP
jgi:hypothetical protein